MPILEQVVSNYDEFKKQPYSTRFRAANDFFDTQLAPDENYKKLPPMERAQIRRNYIDEEIGSTLTGTDSMIGDFFNKFMQGSSRIADIPAGTLEFLNSQTAKGVMDETWLAASADWWRNKVTDSAYWQAKRPTGKYEVPPKWTKPSEWFDPKRLVGSFLENAPYTVAAIAAYTYGGSIAGLVGIPRYTSAFQKGSSLALMMLSEGGDFAQTMRAAEKESGEDIPWHIQAGLAAAVGTANGILENILPERVSRSITRGAKSRLRAVIVNGLINAGYEGFTEVMQEVVTMMGELGVSDEIPDIYGRTAAAFHGAISVGAIFGAGTGMTTPIKAPVEERISEVPVGITPEAKTHAVITSAMTADALDKYAKASMDYLSDPTSDRRLDKLDYETKLIQLARAEGITEEALGKMLTNAKVDLIPVINRIRGTIVPLGTSVEPVKLTTKRYPDIDTLSLKVPRTDGTFYYVPTVTKGTVSRRAVNRAITTFSFLRNEFKDVHDKVSEIVILPEDPKAWVRGAIDNEGIIKGGTVIDSEMLDMIDQDWMKIAFAAEPDPENILNQSFNLSDLRKKAGIMVQKADGTYKLLLRARNEKTISSSDFAYVVGHELGHATQFAAGKVPKEFEAEKAATPALEEAAKAAGIKAQNLFNEANAIHPGLVFSRTNPNADKIGHEAIVRYRALNMLGHNFADIKIAQGELFVEDPLEPKAGLQRVNGYMDMDTRTLWVSNNAAPWVLGHEAAHIAISGLGKDNALVKQGFEMFGGSEEALSDAIGKYFENRVQDQTMMEKLGQWLKDLWAEFVRIIGVQQSEEQLMRSFNRRITDETMFAIPERIAEMQDRRGQFSRLAQDWQDEYVRLKDVGIGTEFSGSQAAIAMDNAIYYRDKVREVDEVLRAANKPRFKMSKLTTTLRFYDNLAKVKGNVNLAQLPLKSLKTEEIAFVKSVAQDLIDAGEKVVTPERLKQAIEAAKIPVSVEVETSQDLIPGVLAMLAKYGGTVSAEGLAELREMAATKPRQITGDTVPGYNLQTHNRWLFTTPVDLGEAAHAGIEATNAIGWAEVAEKEGDPETLMVFEVQPSDHFKAMAATPIERAHLLKGEAGRYIAPHVNSLMYRGLLQEAARKGFTKVLFPVGDTVAQIEGTQAPVDLYNRMAARMEKELPGQTERIIQPLVTEEDLARGFSSAEIKERGIGNEWLQVSLTPEIAEKPFLMFSKKQVETPAFRKWFGESKAVDRKGNPVVFYHGTHADFSIFGEGKVSHAWDSGWYGAGFYFTAFPKVADSYSYNRDRQRSEGRNIMPVYLSIKNPYILTKDTQAEFSRKYLGSTDAEAVSDNKNIVATEVTARLQADGYDGVIARDVLPAEFVVFDSSQIKSATGNIGTFSPENPDIRFSKHTHALWKDLHEQLGPPSEKERKAAPKRKYAPAGTRFGFKDYAETKAAQNTINAMPEDVRKVWDAAARARGNPSDPMSYNVAESYTLMVSRMEEIAQNVIWVNDLYERFKVGNIGANIEGSPLNRYSYPERIGGLYRGLLKKADNILRMDLTIDESGTLRRLREVKLEEYHKFINALKVEPGLAVKQFDLGFNKDRMESTFEVWRAAFAADMPVALREQVIGKIAKGDAEGAKDIIDNWKIKNQKLPTKIKNLLYNVMFEGMLSAASNTKNFSSNTLWTETIAFVLKPIRVGVDAMLSSKAMGSIIPTFKGRERQTYLPEISAFIGELHSARAMKRAGIIAKEAWRIGGKPKLIQTVREETRYLLPAELRNPWDENLDLTTKWEIAVGTMVNPWKAFGIGKAGTRALTIFSRSMVTADVLFKSLVFDAEMQSQIVKEMQRTGKMYNEVEVTTKMKEAAHAMMNKATFMDNPGKIAQSAYAVRGFLDRLGLPGTAIIPFVNTMANILQRGIEFTPGLGILSGVQDTRSELARKNKAAMKIQEKTGVTQPKVRLADSEALTDMITNQIAGVMLTLALMLLLHDDDGEERITGAPPKDARDRVSFYATKQPYSVRVGDHWISYRNVEPLNIVLSNIISFRDALREARNPEDVKGLGDKVLGCSGALIENLFQSSYMEGFMNLIKDGKINPAALGRIPAEFVPYSSLMRAVHRTYEVATTGEYALNDNRKFSAALADALWWVPGEIEHLKKTPRINALGEEIKIHVGKGGLIDGMKLWFPLGVMEAYTDPVEEELASLRIYIGLPSKKMTIRGQEIDLPEDFYREYALLYGKYTKEALSKAISRPGFQSIDAPEKRVDYLKRAIVPARKRARLVAHCQYVQAYLR